MSFEPEAVDIFVGHKIRHYRSKKSWPLKVLADHLKVSLQQVQKYEQGQSRISASLLYKLGKIFDINPSLFFEGFDEKTSARYQSSLDQPHKFNILVIDDSPEDDFIIRKALEGLEDRITIYTVHTGEEALNLFRSLEGHGMTDLPRPQLVFLDIHLPQMNGLDLLRSIKSRPMFHNTPIIILTNSSNTKDMNEAYKHHASGFVKKSFSFDEFKAHLQQVVTYWTQAVELPDVA